MGSRCSLLSSTKIDRSIQGSHCRHVGKNGAENVNDWLRPGSWHVLMFHGIGTLNEGWSPIAEAEFARQMSELAKCRDSGLGEVVTFKEGAQRFRQKRLWQ